MFKQRALFDHKNKKIIRSIAIYSLDIESEKNEKWQLVEIIQIALHYALMLALSCTSSIPFIRIANSSFFNL